MKTRATGGMYKNVRPERDGDGRTVKSRRREDGAALGGRLKRELYSNDASLTGHHRNINQRKIFFKKGAVREPVRTRGNIPLRLLINPETVREPEADRESTF